MESRSVKGYKRESFGKRHTRDIREEGYLPGILYGSKKAPISFKIEVADFMPFIYTPNIYFIDIDIEGQVYRTIIKELQFHPVNDHPQHVDLFWVDPKKPLKMEIPVRCTGNSPGVMLGGKLIQKLRKISVEGMPKKLPSQFEMPIDKLELGQSGRIQDITPIDGVRILNSLREPVATVTIPRALRASSGNSEAEE